jgi:hypothetical protein
MLSHSFRLQTDYFLKLFEDLPSYKLISQLFGFSNHPIWTIGHLSVSYDLLLITLTKKSILPETWHRTFGTGSRPMPINTLYPDSKELVKAFTDCRDDLLFAVGKLTLADYTRPNNIAKYKDHLPTLGDLLSHIMIGHTNYHTGQLVAYRAIHELPRMPEQFDTISVDKESGHFECPICDTKFTKRNVYANHLKSVHADGT